MLSSGGNNPPYTKLQYIIYRMKFQVIFLIISNKNIFIFIKYTLFKLKQIRKRYIMYIPPVLQKILKKFVFIISIPNKN